MTKLEQLKELIGKSTAAKAAYDAAPDNYISYMASAKADAELSYLLHKLLHPLIEVAEGTQALVEAREAKRLDSGVMAVAIGSLKDSLLPLIEDTDK